MTQPYWIKLYLEILNDPKMSRLSDRLFRRTIELFLIAGSNDRSGVLPPVADIAWQLRQPLQKITSDLQSLQDVGILTQENGDWTVTNFELRQSPADAKERVRRYREARKQEQYQPLQDNDVTQNVTKSYNNVTTAETNRYTDTDTDTDTETDSENRTETEAEAEQNSTAALDALPELFRLYENEIGILTAFIADAIKTALIDYPLDWIKSAIQESSRQNKRSWSYVESILKRWKEDGFKTDTRYQQGAQKKERDLDYFRSIYKGQHDHA
jgi:DnaD/phage-associated family protein